MNITEIIIRATLKMLVIWGSLAIIGLPIAKLLVEFAYEVWRDKNV